MSGEWHCAKSAKTPGAPRRRRSDSIFLGALGVLAFLARVFAVQAGKPAPQWILPQQVPQKRQPFLRQVVLRAGERAPDGGGGGDGLGLGGEGLDDGVAVVVDLP